MNPIVAIAGAALSALEPAKTTPDETVDDQRFEDALTLALAPPSVAQPQQTPEPPSTCEAAHAPPSGEEPLALADVALLSSLSSLSMAARPPAHPQAATPKLHAHEARPDPAPSPTVNPDLTLLAATRVAPRPEPIPFPVDGSAPRERNATATEPIPHAPFDPASPATARHHGSTTSPEPLLPVRVLQLTTSTSPPVQRIAATSTWIEEHGKDDGPRGTKAVDSWSAGPREAETQNPIRPSAHTGAIAGETPSEPDSDSEKQRHDLLTGETAGQKVHASPDGAEPRALATDEVAQAEPRGPVSRLEAPIVPKPADRITLQFDGTDGLAGRLRLSVRGDALHATLVSDHPETARRLEGGLGELRRSLGEHGFTDARLTVRQPVDADPRSVRDDRNDSSGSGDRRESERRPSSHEAPSERERRSPERRRTER